jgi:hypothetical protein
VIFVFFLFEAFFAENLVSILYIHEVRNFQKNCQNTKKKHNNVLDLYCHFMLDSQKHEKKNHISISEVK